MGTGSAQSARSPGLPWDSLLVEGVAAALLTRGEHDARDAHPSASARASSAAGQRAHDPVFDRQVVLDDVELGDRGGMLGGRKDHAVGVGHAQLAPTGVDNGGIGLRHPQSFTPLAAGAQRTPRPAHSLVACPSPGATALARIYIIGDNLLIRTLLREILDDAGHEVIGDSVIRPAAMSKVLELRPDMVVLDVVLLRSAGLATLRELVTLDRRLAVVVCAALLERARRSPRCRSVRADSSSSLLIERRCARAWSAR